MNVGDRTVAAIGNFDGVHLGHRRLLEHTRMIADRAGCDAVAVVFAPHPRRYFQPDAPAFLLTSDADRARLLIDAGMARVQTVSFDARLASMTPAAFVSDILKRRLSLAGAVVGEEFRFGRARSGDVALLKSLGRSYGVEVHAIAPLAGRGDGKIGSSGVRDALVKGDVRGAALMLGRAWSVSGVVQTGRKLGRTIGFPTANLTLGDLIEPRRGVYIVRIKIKDQAYGGVANFGRRPTVGGGDPLLEAHLFEFDGDLVGERIEVEFVDFIREEQKFESLDALKDQIARDSEQARGVLQLGGRAPI